MEPILRIPEEKKKAGIRYTLTNDGVELPVIDVSHPAFALEVTAADMMARRSAYFQEQERRSVLPRFIRRPLMHFLLRKSVLWGGLMRASDGFLSGMNTYLLKLGPDNLGAGYTGRGDRQIASSYPVLAVRLRLQDTARLLAEGVASELAANPTAPLHLINIGGGHAADSLNALVLTRRADGRLLEKRKIVIHVLDLEHDAPDFGRRALSALMSGGAPLEGLDATFNFVRYDWAKPQALRDFVEGLGDGDRVIAASTEGALFEYGSDEHILSNLEVLRDATRPGFFIVGSVTRDDDEGRRMRAMSRILIPVRPRGLAVFGALALRAGWLVDRAVEHPFADLVSLTKSQADSH